MKTVQQITRWWMVAGAAACWCATTTSRAQDAAIGAPQSDVLAATARAVDWPQVIRDLDHEDYQVRSAASRQLAEAGSTAEVPLLVDALEHGSPEVFWRATRALEQIAVAGDEAALTAVLKGVEDLQTKGRPELAHLIGGLQEQRLWLEHERSTQRLQNWGAEVVTQEVEADELSSGILFGGFIVDEGLDVDGVDIEVALDGEFPEEAEMPAGVEVEWQAAPRLMTLEEQFAQYEPIEVSCLDRFLQNPPRSLEVPGAIAGWENITAEELAEMEHIPFDPFGAPAVEVAGFAAPADDDEEAVVGAAGDEALERLERVERLLADGAEPVMEAAEAEIDDVVLAELEAEEVGVDEIFELDAVGVWMSDDMPSGETTLHSTAVIGQNWKGGDEGVVELGKLQGVKNISLKNSPLTDAALPHLAKIEQLASLQLQGGKFSPQALLDFRRTHRDISVSARSNAWMGVSPTGKPCQIERVVEDGAAAKAGILAGDVIASVNGLAIEDYSELALILCSHNAGDTVRLEIKRDGKTLLIPVTMQARP